MGKRTLCVVMVAINFLDEAAFSLSFMFIKLTCIFFTYNILMKPFSYKC